MRGMSMGNMIEQERWERVIKGLEQFIADFKPCCGNKADWQRVSDAIALLKAQEPARVKTKHNNGVTAWYVCVECDGSVNPGDRYCRMCGKVLVWE